MVKVSPKAVAYERQNICEVQQQQQVIKGSCCGQQPASDDDDVNTIVNEPRQAMTQRPPSKAPSQSVHRYCKQLWFPLLYREDKDWGQAAVGTHESNASNELHYLRSRCRIPDLQRGVTDRNSREGCFENTLCEQWQQLDSTHQQQQCRAVRLVPHPSQKDV